MPLDLTRNTTTAQFQSLLSSFRGLPPRKEPEKPCFLLDNTRMPHWSPSGNIRRARILEIVGEVCRLGPRSARWSSSFHMCSIAVNVLRMSNCRWLVGICLFARLHKVWAGGPSLATTSVVLWWFLVFACWLRLIGTRFLVQRRFGGTAHDALTDTLIAALPSDWACSICTWGNL